MAVDIKTIEITKTSSFGGDDKVDLAEAGSSGFVMAGTGTYSGSASAQHPFPTLLTLTFTDSWHHTVTQTFNATIVITGNKTFTWTLTDTDLLSKHLHNGTASVTAKLDGETSHSVNFTYAVCFMPGTLIKTPDGQAAVETLKRGDLVSTSDGRTMPVAWLGRQTVSRVFSDPLRILPIRIKAGAIDDNVPARDLLVSPDHAILIDGVLIHAGALVNGVSIVRETNVDSVFVYYHVELADHSLLLAENTPAETFIDNVDRLAFDNWDEHEAIRGDASPLVEMNTPRAKSHRQVPMATRQHLATRAARLHGADVAAA